LSGGIGSADISIYPKILQVGDEFSSLPRGSLGSLVERRKRSGAKSFLNINENVQNSQGRKVAK